METWSIGVNKLLPLLVCRCVHWCRISCATDGALAYVIYMQFHTFFVRFSVNLKQSRNFLSLNQFNFVEFVLFGSLIFSEYVVVFIQLRKLYLFKVHFHDNKRWRFPDSEGWVNLIWEDKYNCCLRVVLKALLKEVVKTMSDLKRHLDY